jgi:hypothetical protein
MYSYRSHCLTSRSMLIRYSCLVGPPGAGGSLATSPPLGGIGVGGGGLRKTEKAVKASQIEAFVN